MNTSMRLFLAFAVGAAFSSALWAGDGTSEKPSVSSNLNLQTKAPADVPKYHTEKQVFLHARFGNADAFLANWLGQTGRLSWGSAGEAENHNERERISGDQHFDGFAVVGGDQWSRVQRR